MGIFDTLLGVGKLATNFLGGGSGKKESTTANQNTSSNTTGKTQASRLEFSEGMLSLLETAAANAVAGSAVGTDSLAAQVQKVRDAGLTKNPVKFDADAFIRDTMAGVDNTLGTSLRQNRNQAVASAGGSTAANSASALLANRLESENAAQRAGALGATTAQAKQIEIAANAANAEALSTETTLLSGLDTSMQSGLATLLNALRGGETYQEVNNRESTTSATSGTSTSRTPSNWTAGLGNLFKDVNQD